MITFKNEGTAGNEYSVMTVMYDGLENCLEFTIANKTGSADLMMSTVAAQHLAVEILRKFPTQEKNFQGSL